MCRPPPSSTLQISTKVALAQTPFRATLFLLWRELTCEVHRVVVQVVIKEYARISTDNGGVMRTDYKLVLGLLSLIVSCSNYADIVCIHQLHTIPLLQQHRQANIRGHVELNYSNNGVYHKVGKEIIA